jgi:hypothetical protein
MSGFDGNEDDAGRHRAIPCGRDGRHLGVVFDDLWANNKSGTAFGRLSQSRRCRGLAAAKA